MSDPRTILLIPYFNNMASLVASLASVGVHEQCDVLVVDDGSLADPVDEEVARASFSAQGTLQVLRLPENQGIEGALNAGLDWIVERDYEFIARLDCGDENIPDRLARQERFLDDHPGVLLVGGAASFVNEAGVEQFVLREPTTRAAIVELMRRNSAFVHPSVMFRTSALPLVGRYPLDVPGAEDYAYFWRFLEVGEVANLPDVLIRYELDPSGISLGRRARQLSSRLKVQQAHDDGSWAARVGIMRTKVLQRLPYGVVFKAKRALNARRGSAAP